MTEGAGDQVFFEWILSYGLHSVISGTNPFFTQVLNAPHGVNLAANTSMPVLAVVFAPVTAFAGVATTFATVLTLNFCCSALAWRAFFRKYLAKSEIAASIGALFCAFAPGFIAHANGHLNWTAGWIAPLFIWRLFQLGESTRWKRNGVLLGLVIVLDYSVNPEALFFTVLATATFLSVWVTDLKSRNRVWQLFRTTLAGLAVATTVSATLLIYPLYMHFRGPQSFEGTGYSQLTYSEELLSYVSFPRHSLAGLLGLSGGHPPNASEATSFLGVLLPVVIFATWRVRRAAGGSAVPVLPALLITGGAFLILSCGPRLRFDGHRTAIAMPYALLARLPLFNSALPLRMGLVVVVVVGALAVLVIDRAMAEGSPVRRNIWALALIGALLPLVPLPLPTTARPAIPRFIADGTWQQFVPRDGTLMTLPLTSDVAPDGQRWQAFTMVRGSRVATMPGGYFLGPGGENGKGRTGAVPLPTSALFENAALTGVVPNVTDSDRRQASRDLEVWNVRLMVIPDELGPGVHGRLYHQCLVDTANALFGPGFRVSDVLVWKPTIH